MKKYSKCTKCGKKIDITDKLPTPFYGDNEYHCKKHLLEIANKVFDSVLDMEII